MAATCANGHLSATVDYCDQCGAPIGTATTMPPPTEQVQASAAESELDTSPAARQQPCPQCGAPRTGTDRYCEGCGYDFAGPAPTSTPASSPVAASTAAAEWQAIATADRGYFDRLASTDLEFPAGYGERRFQLSAAEVRIGRSRGNPPDQALEINLAGAGEDPAVSHLHAVLERQDDGSYTLRDLGSSNGTTINDDPTPVGADVRAPIADGDRIHVGAWTTITLRRA
jgi:hypothetical protein